MDRRLALKQLALFTGGLMVIPSCDFNRENVLVAYEKLQITDAHKKILTKVVETILPGGNIRGAKELNIQDFVLLMANDCLSKEEQKKFTDGLKGFGKYVQKQEGSRFEDMNQSEAEKIFNGFVNDQESKAENLQKVNPERENLKFFLNTTKRFTLQGYLTSEYFMTEVMPYKMIPGGFQGEKMIKPSEIINING
jgi:hypothetical protein